MRTRRARGRGTRASWGAALALGALGLLAGAPAAKAAPDPTVWLCKPGSEPNPCLGSLETTVSPMAAPPRIESPAPAPKPKFDCFYVYPTVSEQPGPNADRTIDPQQVAIAEYQAARFSEVCRVYAPVYRQLTLAAIQQPIAEQQDAIRLAYSDVRSAWRQYLRRYNHARGVVLIGHSQGTGMLTGLVREQIEPRPAARERLISAILLGGNVSVERGRRRGGSFEHIPTCARPSQTGCAIAYSTYNETPPDDTLFGKPSERFGDVFGIPSGPEQRVVCTNPARLRGGIGPLDTISRSEPFPGTLGIGLLILYGGAPPVAATPWFEQPSYYTGQCVQANGADVLLIDELGSAQRLNPSPDATWGLHLADVNIALGNLVRIVRSQGAAYVRSNTSRK